MNILNMALKEIKTDFRDVRTLIFLLAFPVVLMLILGTALSSAFNSTPDVDDVHIVYQDTSNADLSHAFRTFTDNVADAGIHFTKMPAGINGKTAVKEGDYDGYIQVTNSGITVYENEDNTLAGNIIEGTLHAFTDKYKVMSSIYTVAPEAAGEVAAGSGTADYIQETSLNAAKQPGAMDYYALTMTAMIAFFGSISATSLIRSERTLGTDARLIAAPITKAEIFTGKILGSIVVSGLCTLVVVLFSKFVFHADWGSHSFFIFLVLLSEIILATSLGVIVSYITKTAAASRALIMVIVQLAAFFGGSYFEVNPSEGLSQLIKLSPLRWQNDALISLVYTNEFSIAIQTILLNTSIAALFLLGSIFAMRKREGL